jgi:hypothetical protein
MGKIYSNKFFQKILFLLIIDFRFQDAVVQYLNDRSANIVFLLWGRDAQNKGARINKVVLMIIFQRHTLIMYLESSSCFDSCTSITTFGL